MPGSSWFVRDNSLSYSWLRKPNKRRNAEEWEAIVPGNLSIFFQLEDFPFNRPGDETYQRSSLGIFQSIHWRISIQSFTMRFH